MKSNTDILLFEGSESLVYLSRGIKTTHPTVIKVIKDEHPSSHTVLELENEFALTENLAIVGVRKTLGKKIYNGRKAILLEYIDGKSVSEYFCESQRHINEFLTIAIQILAIIERLHSVNIIHQKLTGSNILIRSGNADPVLIDFGLATRLSPNGLLFSSPEKISGALTHLAPEQTGRVHLPVDQRSDLYNLGVTFYEMLVHELPFTSTDPLELVHNHVALAPVPPHQKISQIPEQISSIIMHMLEKSPEERYQSAHGVKCDLEKCLQMINKGLALVSFSLGEEDYTDRLVFPTHLYGREEELGILLANFERVACGRAELQLICGHAGVGKTTLVHDMRAPIVARGGLLVEGKFDQFLHNVPYSAWIDALTGLVRQILSFEEVRLNETKKRILTALGKNGRLLTDLIPALELVIGTQPPLAALGGVEASNRFNYVFQRFIQGIAAENQPLVIFLDDMQWADGASLELLRSLISDQNGRSLWVIGAYREEDSHFREPLTFLLNEFEKHKYPFHQLHIGSLTENNLVNLVVDTFHCPSKEARPLAHLICAKTNGDAFFVRQMLVALVERGALSFSHSAYRWQWDMKALNALEITENVVELITEKLNSLPLSTRKVIGRAACIGGRFDLAFLRQIPYQPDEDIIRDIQLLVQEGFIIPLDVDYKFVHDRIQQSAYAALSENERNAIHWSIGKEYLRQFLQTGSGEDIFDIVNHLNFGVEGLKNPAEKIQLAELNLQAGRRAKTSTAYPSADNYLSIGLSLLDEACWNTHYRLMLAFYQESAEVCTLCGQYERMAQLAAKVHEKALSVLDEVAVYETEIKSLTAQGSLQEAVRLGIAALARFDMHLVLDPTPEEAFASVQNTLAILEQCGIEKIGELPEMTSLEKLACMRILGAIGEPAYVIAPLLLVLWASVFCGLSLKEGNTSWSPFAYAAFALVLSASEKTIEAGYRLGKQAMLLIEPLKAQAIKCRVYNINGCMIQPWKEPLRNSIPILEEGIAGGIETGDYTSGGFNAWNALIYAFFMGEALDALSDRIQKNIKTILYFRQSFVCDWAKFTLLKVMRLRGETSSAGWEMTFDENQWLENARRLNDHTGLCYYYLNKLIAGVLFNDHPAAEAAAGEVLPIMDGFQGTFGVPLFYFYDSLAILRRCTTVQTLSDRMFERVTQNRTRLEKMAVLGPMNFQHKVDLLTAELGRVTGDSWLAARSYDRSIRGARENRFIHEAALANELAGSFYLQMDMSDLACHYISEARQAYIQWQAWAKVRDLEDRFPHWFLGSPDMLQKTIQASSDGLDIYTIIRTAQMISSEIDLARLLTSLMKEVVENAGAQNGYLLMEWEQKWVIEAEQRLDQSGIRVMKHIPLEGCGCLSSAIAHFVIRSHEMVILDNTTEEGAFIQDEYVLKYKPKSTLCLPLVVRGRLIGILYLENNLVAAAFTPERVRLLEILAAQAATSLENATYYSELIRLNQSFEQEIVERKRTEEALRESEEIFNLFIEHSPIYMFFKDENIRSLKLSRNFEQMLGRPLDELLGKDMNDLFPSDLARSMVADDKRILRKGKPTFVIEELAGRTYTTTKFPILRKGKPALLAGYTIDITEQKQAEHEIRKLNDELEQRVADRTARLEQALKELESFSYSISHDLRAPLRAINGFSNILQEDYGAALAPEAQTLLFSIRKNTEKMGQLIDELLAFSRVSRQDIRRVQIDMTGMARSVFEELLVLHPERKIEFKLADLAPAYGDAAMIRQVLTNLLSNAIKFTAKRAQALIEIDSISEGQRVTYVIRDNGVGFDMQYKHKLFGVFQRLHHVNDFEGTGVGLAIVQRIVLKHGGRVWAEGRLNEGASFFFTLGE